MRKKAIIISMLVLTTTFSNGQNIYLCNNGVADFISDAPLEMIKASSTAMIGALNLTDRSFSFKIASRSFQGFNSALQRTHFNEDYLESELYPNSTFKGKIIEGVDLSVPGRYTIRAKGKLTVHGVEFDRIIRCTLNVVDAKIIVDAKFTVFLDDHNISIPTIVNQKIAEEIKVEIKLNLIPN